MNMNLSLITLLASAAAATAPAKPAVVTVKETLSPRIHIASFHSTILERRKQFGVILPVDYDRTKDRWPVLFLLHGRGRHERSLIDDTITREALLQSRGIVILPDGDDGWYINSPIRERDRYADYLDELVAAADAHYRTSRQRDLRGLSGWSMGGYGCVMHAIRRPQQFGAVAPMIGLLDFPRTGLPKDFSYDVPTDRFGSDPKRWQTLNPIHQTENLRGMAIQLITADRAFDRVMNQNFSQHLEQLRIPHTFEILEGGHTFDIVRQAVPRVVAFMNDEWETAAKSDDERSKAED